MKKKRGVINILQREKTVKANNIRKIKNKARPRREEEAAVNLKQTALTFNQPHLLVLSLPAFCGFQTLLNTEQGRPQESKLSILPLFFLQFSQLTPAVGILQNEG